MFLPHFLCTTTLLLAFVAPSFQTLLPKHLISLPRPLIPASSRDPRYKEVVWSGEMEKGCLQPGCEFPTLSLPLLPPASPLSLPLNTPTIFMQLNLGDDGFQRAVITLNSSVDWFIADSHQVPGAYVFSGASKAESEFIKARILERVEKMGLEEAWKGRLFFAPPFPSPFPELWSNWTVGYKRVVAKGVNVTRLDAEYLWLPWPGGMEGVGVEVLESCAAVHANMSGKIAVVGMDVGVDCVPKNCSFADQLLYLQNAGVSGAIIGPKHPLFEPGSSDLERLCLLNATDRLDVQIPASFISHSSLTALTPILPSNISFWDATTSGAWAAADASGAWAQVGWEKLTQLRRAGWEMEFLNYTARLQANLSAPSYAIPIFDKEVMQGEKGLVANLTLPSNLTSYTTLTLDLALSCPGVNDDTCAIWDHIPQLFARCSPGQKADQSVELGRWITPFRRRVGRWLTDVSPLLPLLSHSPCTFQLKLAASWAKPWVPSLTLRLSNPSQHTPPSRSLTPLFNGNFVFNSSYNNRDPVEVEVPSGGMRRAQLITRITGHGYDNNGCGEFCSTSHVFEINSNLNLTLTFDHAGSLFGSTFRVIDGVEPNEHGTWTYGRDGWCDGWDVRPWVVDIPLHEISGDSVRVKYYGLYDDKTPNPTHDPGYMIVSSWIAWEEE